MENKLAYIHQGSGIPMLLLHGFCERKEIWNDFIPLLSKEAQIIAPDLPGFGENPPITKEITIDSVAEAVAEFLKSIKIQQAIIVGHSLGGYVSLALAELYPHLCKGLCLFHSTAKADSEEKKANRNKAAAFLEKNGTEPFAHNFVPSLFASVNHQKMADQIALMKQVVADTHKDTAVAYTKAMQDRPERINVLEKAAFPCLFIAGKDDQAVPYNDMLQQSKLPKRTSELVSLENCGHMGMYEQKNESIEALINFIKTVKSKP